MPRPGAVQLCALVEIGGNVHQHAAEGQHRVGDADPHIDDDHADARQGLVRQERQWGRDEPQPHQRDVDRAHRFQRTGDEQQAYKLRDGDGNDKERPPHLLHPYQLVVDEDRQQHSEDIVGEGGQDRPDDRPAEDAEEGVGLCLVAEEDVRHVGEPRPGEKLTGRLMGGVKVGEGNQHHKHDGQHREGHKADHRRGQQCRVKVAVQQALQILAEGRNMLAMCIAQAQLSRALQIQEPEIEKQDRRRDGEHAEQEDQHGVVAGDALVDLQLLVPDLELCVFAQRSEMGEVLPAEAEEETEEGELGEQIQQSLSELAETEAAASHDKKREVSQRVLAVSKGSKP